MKEDTIKLEGTIVEVLRNTTYRVQMPNHETPILATLSGKMRQHNIKVIAGDLVEVEFSLYDLTRGRIVHRR